MLCSCLGEVFVVIECLLSEVGLCVVNVFYVGDGNFYLLIFFDNG